MSGVLAEDERKNYLSQIERLQEEHAFMKKILKHIFPENTEAFYLCGEEGDKDDLGLPEFVMICPAFGKQELKKYKRVD
jgi:hypothetical protein